MTLYIGSKPTAPGITGIFGALWQDSTGSLNWKDLYGNNIVLGAGGGGTSGQTTWGCIVDANGEGDYLDLGSALDAGETSIFIRNGVYNMNGFWTIENSATQIVGESFGGVVFKYNNSSNNAAGLRIYGNSSTDRINQIFIKNIKVVCGSDRANSNGLIDINYADDVILENIYMEGGDPGEANKHVTADYADNLTIRYSTFRLGSNTIFNGATWSNYAIYVTRSLSTKIYNNFVQADDVTYTGEAAPPDYKRGICAISVSVEGSDTSFAPLILYNYVEGFTNGISLSGNILHGAILGNYVKGNNGSSRDASGIMVSNNWSYEQFYPTVIGNHIEYVRGVSTGRGLRIRSETYGKIYNALVIGNIVGSCNTAFDDSGINTLADTGDYSGKYNLLY